MLNNDPQTFSERVQWLRAQRGLTLAQIAEGTGLAISYLSRLTSGVRANPSAATTLTLASYFNVNREWLETGRGAVFPLAEAGGAKARLNQLLSEIDATVAGHSRLEQVASNIEARLQQFRFSSDEQRAGYIVEIQRELTAYSDECATTYPRMRDALLDVARALADEGAAESLGKGDETSA